MQNVGQNGLLAMGRIRMFSDACSFAALQLDLGCGTKLGIIRLFCNGVLNLDPRVHLAMSKKQATPCASLLGLRGTACHLWLVLCWLDFQRQAPTRPFNLDFDSTQPP